MATEAIKSTVITNADATPVVINPAYLDGARVRVKRGVATSVLAAADVGSTYRFGRIRSNDVVKEVKLDNATLGAGAAMDFGLYKTAKDGGAVVDADLFASAVDMNTANRALDITRESGVITVANMQKRVWELLGLTTDPQIEYDITGTTTTIHAAAGSMCVTAEVVGGY